MRASAPIDGVEITINRRDASKRQIANLTNGPSKLCTAMGITKKQNDVDLCIPPIYVKDSVTFQRHRSSKRQGST